jgi:hypothetical protein
MQVIRKIRIGELGKTFTATSNRSVPISVILMLVIKSFESSVITRATKLYVSGDGILHSHRRENLSSYIALTGGLCNGEVM